MEMIISEISYSNIRKIKELKINFFNGNKFFRNTFIMMANGTGKTMSMDLIKGILDESANTWKPNKVKSFKPLNRDVDNGQFCLTVLFDNKKYKYFLDFDFVNNKSSIRTTVSAEVGGGIGKRRLPEELKDLFLPEFVQRFVFDGEQAKKVLDSGSTEAEEAIKYLYRLDELDKLLIENDALLQKYQQERDSGRGTDQSLKIHNTRKAECLKTIDFLTSELAKIEIALEENKKNKEEKSSLLDEINKKSKALDDAKNELLVKLSEIKSKVEISVYSILEISRKPYMVSTYFCDIMQSLGQNMKKLKLPKTISRGFFKELAAKDTCICGRELTEKERKVIIDNCENYLGEDQQGTLNKIKNSLTESIFSDNLNTEYDNLKHWIKEENKINNQLSKVLKDLEKSGGDEATNLRCDIDSLIAEIGRLESERKTIISKDDKDFGLNEKNNLAKAQKLLAELESKIAKATQTNIDLKRKLALDKYVSEILNTAKKKLKESIIVKANKKIAEIISDDIVEIEKIDKHIILKEKSGASEAQTLSVAYCYIGTLFEDSSLKFPFIIDSPVGKVDLEKRWVIADIIPKLFPQIISFVTSSEIRCFAEKFYKDDESNFITIEAGKGYADVKMTEGVEYFDEYQKKNPEESKNEF